MASPGFAASDDAIRVAVQQAAAAGVTVWAFTTDPTEAPLLRIPISADAMNGLRQPSSLMVDRITTMARSKMGERLGRLADEDM
ncbi:MAG: type II toxin-antitoxin system PemK/MazF family toxin, partial [Pseudonocardiaceae bacterium]